MHSGDTTSSPSLPSINQNIDIPKTGIKKLKSPKIKMPGSILQPRSDNNLIGNSASKSSS